MIFFLEIPFLVIRRIKDLTVSIADIDVSRSLLVFISHSWSRGWSGADGWDGRPHPDNKFHEKLALCQKGIKKLWEELAPSCDNCYIWLDFACINQDGSPCAELKQLDKIIQFCDCIFTPIVENEKEDEEFLKLSAEANTDEIEVGFSHGDDDAIAKHYKSKKWNGDDHAYLNRGWTRVEMFYASAIPFLTSDLNQDETIIMNEKSASFKAGLHSAVSQGRRPQFVYGSYQMKKHLPMRVLPPLLHSYFHRYNPMNGNLSVSSDRDKIVQLVDELMPFLNFAVESYDGASNKQGLKHGHGKCCYKNGDVYEGEFVNDKKDGVGTYIYSDGSKYEGDWRGDKENGFGAFTYACGDVYTGEMADGQFHGKGEIVSVRGRKLKGTFVNDKFIGDTKGSGVDVEDHIEGDNDMPRFERNISVCYYEDSGFDRNLSCSSGGSDFDADLSVASGDS